MTQLALLKRKINFASDKQISHVIICTYKDKEKECLEFSLARIPHTQPPPSTAPEKNGPCGDGIQAPGSLMPPRSLLLCPAPRLPGTHWEPHDCLDFP